MKEDDLKKMRAMFWNTNHELQFYLQQYESSGNVNLLICAAIEWGLMCGTAFSANIVGSNALLEKINELKPKLFPHEYNTDEQNERITS